MAGVVFGTLVFTKGKKWGKWGNGYFLIRRIPFPHFPHFLYGMAGMTYKITTHEMWGVVIHKKPF